MPKTQYKEIGFGPKRLAEVKHANEIIAEYDAKGFKLTLRQLYYQFVARGLIPNRSSEYQRLGVIINHARLGGLIDWSAIEDRGRNLQSVTAWRSPDQIIGTCAEQYRIDLWSDQPKRFEVWIEKEALVGVIEPVCRELRVAWFACKGYVSQSEMWHAGANRIRGYCNQGQTPIIIHLGDHDPSGIDMSRDIEDRLSMFAGRPVEVRRIALNMKQIDEFKPPPNPAKVTDSRFESYQATYGDESWELDALDPETLARLIREAVEPEIDLDRWDGRVKLEKADRSLLAGIVDRMDDIHDMIQGDLKETDE